MSRWCTHRYLKDRLPTTQCTRRSLPDSCESRWCDLHDPRRNEVRYGSHRNTGCEHTMMNAPRKGDRCCGSIVQGSGFCYDHTYGRIRQELERHRMRRLRMTTREKEANFLRCYSSKANSEYHCNKTAEQRDVRCTKWICKLSEIVEHEDKNMTSDQIECRYERWCSALGC